MQIQNAWINSCYIYTYRYVLRNTVNFIDFIFFQFDEKQLNHGTIKELP